MAEVPKTAARTIVASVVTPAVEELVERYARRARREVARVPEGREPIALEYVLGSPAARAVTLRRLLDEIDPAVRAGLRPRGREPGRGRRSASLPRLRRRRRQFAAPAARRPGTALAVLYDLPATHEELREAVAGAARRIALIQPRQLESLRALSLGGTLKPHRLPERGRGVARARRERARGNCVRSSTSGTASRELLSLEPLLDEFDGAEVAAAALKLLEQERLAERARVRRAGTCGGE